MLNLLLSQRLLIFSKIGEFYMGWFSQLFNNKNQVPPSILPGKNDPCWCSSGIKYKKCHLAKDKLYFKEHPNPPKKAPVKKSCGPVFG